MLNGSFKEGVTKEIVIGGGKSSEHVIKMFKYFDPKKMPNYNRYNYIVPLIGQGNILYRNMMFPVA